MYLLLTGRKPFTGDTVAVMFKIVYEDPVPPTALNLHLHPALDYIVLRCLAKDPDRRYGSAQELLDDLDDVEHGRPVRSQASLPLYALPRGEPTLAQALPPPTSRQTADITISRKSWVAAGATILLLIVLLVAADLGLGAYRVWISQHPPPAGISTAPPSAPLGMPGWAAEDAPDDSPPRTMEESPGQADIRQPTREEPAVSRQSSLKSRQPKKAPVTAVEALISSEASAASAPQPTPPPLANPAVEVMSLGLVASSAGNR